jgi:signal transduction histidine kinase
LSDLAQARDVSFARALILAGLVWSLSALSASSEPAWYSLGRLSQWFVELAIVYVLLVFPSGRLLEQTDRRLFAVGALLVGLLYLPTALVAQFPHPALWSTCTSACPSNPFALGHTTPALVTDLVVPVREALTVAVLAAVAVAVTRRWRSAGPLFGQLYAPIAWIAVLQVVVFVLYFPIRRAAPGSWTLPVLSWADALTLPAVALACIAGRTYRRLFAAAALDRIARDVRTSATAAHVRRAMADALEDPSLRILHSFRGDFGRWVDETGSPVALPRDGAAEQVTEVASGSWRIAIVHDPALAEDRSLIQTAGCYVLAALENDRLSGELRSSLEQLAESQARSIAAEDRERQKIERDLHDGAQQRLVAMRVKLGLAAAKLESQDPASAEVIRTLGRDIDATIDEVRGFARGIYPPLLVQTGLREALRAIGRVAALPTTVHADQLDRYQPEIETTVYFSCSEALQNAAKHARGATRVTISVWQDRDLHFEIRDDGAGFDPQDTPFGTGLGSLHDRLAAVNGTMTIHSGLDQGTTVTGTIPIPFPVAVT